MEKNYGEIPHDVSLKNKMNILCAGTDAKGGNAKVELQITRWYAWYAFCIPCDLPWPMKCSHEPRIPSSCHISKCNWAAEVEFSLLLVLFSNNWLLNITCFLQWSIMSQKIQFHGPYQNIPEGDIAIYQLRHQYIPFENNPGIMLVPSSYGEYQLFYVFSCNSLSHMDATKGHVMLIM